MDSIQILKRLISIPSYVDSKNNESKISEWIFNYLTQNTTFMVKKQWITRKRFNVIASLTDKPNALVTGHLDTVQPKKAWTINPFSAKEADGKIYGLGASDMKAGLASLLSVASEQESQNTMYLFYCDEEYDFLGMKKFIEEYKNKINPKLIVSADGDNLQISNSCRGLIELTIKVKGKSGHAANPDSGINAILRSLEVINNLNIWLRQYSSPELGKSTFNVSFIKGGSNIGQKKDDTLLSREGNIIPDYCEYVLEVRSATNRLNANTIENYIKRESRKMGLKVTSISTRHNLKSWITPIKELANILAIAPKKRIFNSKKSGYINVQMLWEAFNKVPTFTFGPAELGMAHKENEFVKLKSLVKAEQFFSKLLSKKQI